MNPILYGVGVGPGDPELLTLKAARILRECDVIAVPDHGSEALTAYEIALGAVSTIADKPLVKLSLPMLSDRAAWDAYHDAAAAELISILRSGRSVAFLTLGDPSIYSTYLYLHRRVRAAGLDAQMIPGVPSFCAAAAAMGEGLAEGGVPLHIVPASYEGLDEALGWRGVKVLMKTGHFFPAVRESLRHAGVLDKTTLITRCGMSGEQVTDALDSVEHAGYFSLFVVRE